MTAIRNIAFSLLVGLAAWPTPSRAAGAPSAASVAEGQKLAADIRNQVPEENVEVNGILIVRDGDGKRTRIPFHYQVIVNGETSKVIYETRPASGSATEKLVVVRSPGHPNEYSRTVTPASSSLAGQPDLISGDQAMTPYAGSDFWLADLGLEFLHWPQHRIVEEARIKMRKGRPCKVLESINPQPGAKGYTRVRSWIDTKTGGVILAEAYGPDNKLLKEFEIGGLIKVNGQWELKNMEMRNAATDTQTVLEFKYQRKSAD